MKITEFAAALHITRAVVYKMISKKELPLKDNKLDFMAFCEEKNVDLACFYRGQYWSKQSIKRDSGIDNFYEFNNIWKLQNNKAVFKIGKVEYFLIK